MTGRDFDQATGRRRYFDLLDEATRRLVDPATGKVGADLVETIPCPLCESHQAAEPLFVKDGFSFGRCPCGMVYVNPRIRQDSLLDLYGGSDTFYSSWTDVLRSEENQRWQIPYFDDMLDRIDAFQPGRRLLEIGCSIGLFMEQAQRRNFRCVGLELEEQAYTHAKSRGLDVRRKTLEDAAFADGQFDVVAMFGVLEHVPEPRRLLREVRRVLSPNGLVIAVVPNVYSLAASVLREKSRMFSGYNHLQYFSMDTLRRVFQMERFEPVAVDTVLTALDSVLNAMQFVDPSEPSTTRWLPEALGQRAADPESRALLERSILDADLGLRARAICRRVA